MQIMCAHTHTYTHTHTHTHLHTHALPTTALETVSCPTASIFPKMIFSRNCFKETLSASSAWLWTWDQRDNRNQDQNTVNFYALHHQQSTHGTAAMQGHQKIPNSGVATDHNVWGRAAANFWVAAKQMRNGAKCGKKIFIITFSHQERLW